MSAVELTLITPFDRGRMPSGRDWPAPSAFPEVYPVVRSERETMLSHQGDRSAFREHNQ